MIVLLVPEILPAAELADLQLDITDEEILADLTFPGPPPGRSEIPVSEGEARLS